MKKDGRCLVRILYRRLLLPSTVFTLLLSPVPAIPAASASGQGMTDLRKNNGQVQQEDAAKEQAGQTGEGQRYTNEDLEALEKAGKSHEKGQYTNEDLKQYETGSTNSQAEAYQIQASGTESQEDEDRILSGAPEPTDPAEAEEGEEANAAQDAEAADAGDEDPWSTIGVYTDDLGRGEGYWRRTMAEAREELVLAREAREKMLTEINVQRGISNSWQGDPAVLGHFHDLIEDLRVHLEEAEKRFTAAEQHLADLEEEARRTKALPGWLR